MDFEPSSKAQDYLQRLSAFMDAEVYRPRLSTNNR